MSVTGTGTHLHVLGSLGGGDLLPGEGGDKVLVFLRLLPTGSNRGQRLKRQSREIGDSLHRQKIQTEAWRKN